MKYAEEIDAFVRWTISLATLGTLSIYSDVWYDANAELKEIINDEVAGEIYVKVKTKRT